MPRSKSKAIEPSPRKYNRRGEEQLIADLQAKIQGIKARAAAKAAQRDPTFRHVNKAIRSIDAAMASTGDQALRGALQEARATLSACLQFTYPDTERRFSIKARGGTAPGSIVIESLLPNPVGDENVLEEVTIRNAGGTTVTLAGWMLRDAHGHALSLESLGQVAPGQSLTIRRNGAAMSQNNNGDTITVFGPSNQPGDSFTYSATTEGVRIVTEH